MAVKQPKSKTKTATEKKPAIKKPLPKSKKETKEIALPDKVVISAKDLGLEDLDLTDKEIRYVYLFTNPEYTDTFQVKARAAVKAGYKAETARITAVQLHGKPKVAEAINRLLEYHRNEVKEEYELIIRRRMARIRYNVADYYKKVTIFEKNPITEKLEEKEIEVLKDISELTPEQLLAVDGVDYKGQAGRKVFQFADREKSMSEMTAIYKSLYGGPAGDGNDDGEATIELIRERLTIKTTIRKSKDEISNIAGFIQDRGGSILAQEL
ncbi:MAG: terminase small subunit [Treponema sp.]|nr:terminase small subunit [Treponema sp.]